MSLTRQGAIAVLLAVVLAGGAPFVAPSTTADAASAGTAEFTDSEIPTQVPVGERVNGSLTVTNTGSESMQVVVKSYFQGSQFNTRRVRLAPGEDRTFDVSRRVPDISPGTYSIRFTTQNDSLSADVQVVPSSARFERPDDGNDEIDTVELQAAISAWAQGEISTDVLRDVIRDWATGEVVA